MQQMELTLDWDLDGARLSALASAVAECMSDGRWRTLGEMRFAIGRGSETGISARLRELHAKRGVEYEKRRRGMADCGTWEYRFVIRCREYGA